MAFPLPDRGLAAGRVRSADALRDASDRVEDVVVRLFDQFRDPLLRYLASLGLALADGEEVVQEVFCSLYQHLRHGKPRENLPAWLFRVAQNLACKRRRQARREFEVRTEVGSGELTIDPEPDPEMHVVIHQSQERLMAVVEALPEQDRRCLFLRAEGLRYREIAEVLDLSLGSVSLALARSLARIARAAEQ